MRPLYNSIPSTDSPFLAETSSSSSTSSLGAGLRNQRNFRLKKFQILARKQFYKGLKMRPLLNVLPLAALVLFCGCGPRATSSPDTIVSMQTLDRNGFSETISNFLLILYRYEFFPEHPLCMQLRQE
ncbi:MAG: hypothetical protein K940chlam2_00329 [Chlamydiae bacterium]|nr:hypothetical protein [Chlamydiota bacterium]